MDVKVLRASYDRPARKPSLSLKRIGIWADAFRTTASAQTASSTSRSDNIFVANQQPVLISEGQDRHTSGGFVSHVIVLFDFIGEMHKKGEPFEQAIRDAGIERLRPVLITVAATILALFPLASHGGPLWKPLCYAQIGGLAVATFITLLLVPVFYSIAVQDLRIVKWETARPAVDQEGADDRNTSNAQ